MQRSDRDRKQDGLVGGRTGGTRGSDGRTARDERHGRPCASRYAHRSRGRASRSGARRVRPLWRDATRSSERMRRLRSAAPATRSRRAAGRLGLDGAPAPQGVGEALAVMLSVVVFGLGVMTLVARNEVTLSHTAPGLGAGFGGAHAASTGATTLPGHGVAR